MNVDTFVRTAKEVAAIGGAKIFPKMATKESTIHVGLLQQKLPAETAKKLAAVRTAQRRSSASPPEYYWLCRTLTHESKVWTLPEIKAPKTSDFNHAKPDQHPKNSSPKHLA